MVRRAVSIIGLGKLGCPLAARFAAKGYRVVGADLDARRCEAIRARRLPDYEPGLAETLAAAGDRLIVGSDPEAAVRESWVTFVMVPTPTGPRGDFELTHVLAACEAIGRALREKTDFHVVVVSSTVMPGATGGPVRHALEAASGRRAGADFGLCYSPEFVALGSVLRDLSRPDFLLIGESDPRAGEMLTELLYGACENRPPVARMNFVNAELAKLAVNTFITMKITVGNTLARLCERLPAADVDQVTAALGLDRRIGGQYLRGGAAYGGPCFPRDNRALAALARQLDVAAMLPDATDASNDSEILRLAALVQQKLPPGGTVGILGLAYKPGSNVVEASAGLRLAAALAARDCSVVGYDPAAMPAAAAALGRKIRCVASAEACVTASDVVVLMAPWPEFQTLDPRTFRRTGARRVVIDCWRVWPADAFGEVADYVALGRSGALGPPREVSRRSRAHARHPANV